MEPERSQALAAFDPHPANRQARRWLTNARGRQERLVRLPESLRNDERGTDGPVGSPRSDATLVA